MPRPFQLHHLNAEPSSVRHCDSRTINAINGGGGRTSLSLLYRAHPPPSHKERPIKGIYIVLKVWIIPEKLLANLAFRSGLAAARPLIHRPSSLQPQQTWLLSSIRASSSGDAQVRRSSHYSEEIKASSLEELEYFWFCLWSLSEFLIWQQINDVDPVKQLEIWTKRT